MDFQVSIFSIILILAFYLPRYYFRRFYYSDFSTKQLGSGEWYDRFFKSIFYGTVLQLVILKILRENFRINYDSVSTPINQIFRKIWEGKLPNLDYSNFSNAISYLILSVILSCLAGYLFRRFIRFIKIDSDNL